MIEALRKFRFRPEPEEEPADEPAAPFPSLRLTAASLLLAVGASSTLQQLNERAHSGETADREPERAGARTAAWAPLVVGSLAAAAQITHALRPSAATLAATRALNGGAVGVGLASAVNARTLPPAALALGSAGVLGWLLDRREQASDREREQLEERARLVERWVPRRRSKVDHIVVHV